MARQRKIIWRGWIEGTDHVELYDQQHLTYIILYFPTVWNFTLPLGATEEDVTTAMRFMAKAEIIELMVCMYILPPESLLKVQQIRRSRRKLSKGALLSLQSPKRRRIATPEVDIDDEDSGDESDDEEVDIQPGPNDADPVKDMITKLTKTNIRKMLLSGDPDKMMRAGSLEIGAVVAHEEDGDIIRANALINEWGGKALSIPDFNALQSISKSRL